ncbi:MAG: response regulator transcription factor [Bacteroidetes bacterium]|nr:response regulator transcription factor [Bacteroidota bacterium]
MELATKEIKMVCKEVKIIIVSMLDNPSMVGKALKAGADAYVLKNSGPEDLIHAFKAVIKNITYITPSLALYLAMLLIRISRKQHTYVFRKAL